MSLRVLWGSTLHKYEFFEVRGSHTIVELSDGKATYVVLHANHPRELSDVCAVLVYPLLPDRRSTSPSR